VFRIIKFLVGVAVLAGFVWFGANVPLGSHTLFEHLQAIGRTRETKDLLDGTRETAKPLMDSVRRKLAQEALGEKVLPPDGGVPPADDVPESDRQELKRVLAGEHSDKSADHGATKSDHPTHAARPGPGRSDRVERATH
jgi:hypothetical protein